MVNKEETVKSQQPKRTITIREKRRRLTSRKKFSKQKKALSKK